MPFVLCMQTPKLICIQSTNAQWREILKKKKMKIDTEALKKYLKSLSLEDFKYAKQGVSEKIIKGNAIDDIDFFKKDLSKILLNTVINYGEPFLVDAIGNDLSLVYLTRRKYKLPNGRVCRFKFIETIITDCNRIYGSPLRGYWKVPKQFLYAD